MCMCECSDSNFLYSYTILPHENVAFVLVFDCIMTLVDVLDSPLLHCTICISTFRIHTDHKPMMTKMIAQSSSTQIATRMTKHIRSTDSAKSRLTTAKENNNNGGRSGSNEVILIEYWQNYYVVTYGRQANPMRKTISHLKLKIIFEIPWMSICLRIFPWKMHNISRLLNSRDGIFNAMDPSSKFCCDFNVIRLIKLIDLQTIDSSLLTFH